MSQLYTLNDLEALAASDPSLASVPPNAILTPSARDFLKARGKGNAPSLAPVPARSAPAAPIVPDYEFRWTPGNDPQTPAEIAAFYASPEVTKVKEQMCAMGRRMWTKSYTDGNGGNLTVRVGDNLVLCTPTLVSKGFMEPDMIALIDMEGNQLAGKFKRTSEAMTHLGIMKRQPAAKACCHAHPPHATAYAVAKVKPPSCLIPEAEVFLGVIGEATYKTPGSPENADEVGEVAVKHQSVLMQNHGVICWGKDIEDAYWKMENTDAYCQTVLLASMLGRQLTPIDPGQAKELIGIRKQLGMEDYRDSWQECQLCDNSGFQPGFYAEKSDEGCGCPVPEASAEPDAEAEALVRQITETIVGQLSSSGA